MSRVKETHLWFENGDDEIQVESYSKKLNEAILELNKMFREQYISLMMKIAIFFVRR